MRGLGLVAALRSTHHIAVAIASVPQQPSLHVLLLALDLVLQLLVPRLDGVHVPLEVRQIGALGLELLDAR